MSTPRIWLERTSPATVRPMEATYNHLAMPAPAAEIHPGTCTSIFRTPHINYHGHECAVRGCTCTAPWPRRGAARETRSCDARRISHRSDGHDYSLRPHRRRL